MKVTKNSEAQHYHREGTTMTAKTKTRTRTMTGLNPAVGRTGATNSDERIRAGGLRRFALSAILGLAVLAGSLGSARAARAANCLDNGCQYWQPSNGEVYILSGNWRLLTQDCHFSSNWFYCGSEWEGHYLPDQDESGWWWYKRVDGTWFYLFAANDAAGGWYFQPYQDSAASGGTETSSTSGGAVYMPYAGGWDPSLQFIPGALAALQ